MIGETVILKTDTLAELMGMALLAANTGILPKNAYEEWFELRFGREIGFKIDGLENGWGREEIRDLNSMVDGWAQRFKANKAFEKISKHALAKEKESEAKTDYDHPQRYTGEDGKDLIDRMEEGLINEEQTRGFLKGNVLKYVTRYEDKNGIDDLIKAHEYLRRLIAFEDGGDSDEKRD